MNKQILTRYFDKKDFLVDVVLAMNGTDCKKYVCEYLRAAGY